MKLGQEFYNQLNHSDRYKHNKAFNYRLDKQKFRNLATNAMILRARTTTIPQ